MVGDLALAGCDLAGRFAAYRSGHRLNAELVRAMLPAQRPETVCINVGWVQLAATQAHH